MHNHSTGAYERHPELAQLDSPKGNLMTIAADRPATGNAPMEDVHRACLSGATWPQIAAGLGIGISLSAASISAAAVLRDDYRHYAREQYQAYRATGEGFTLMQYALVLAATESPACPRCRYNTDVAPAGTSGDSDVWECSACDVGWVTPGTADPTDPPVWPVRDLIPWRRA